MILSIILLFFSVTVHGAQNNQKNFAENLKRSVKHDYLAGFQKGKEIQENLQRTQIEEKDQEIDDLKKQIQNLKKENKIATDRYITFGSMLLTLAVYAPFYFMHSDPLWEFVREGKLTIERYREMNIESIKKFFSLYFGVIGIGFALHGYYAMIT